SIEGFGTAGPKTLAAIQIALAPNQPATISSTFLTGGATGAFEYSGWLPAWRAASSTADVLPHLQQLKTVMPFAYKVLSDGTIADNGHFTEEPWASFIAGAKAQNVRVIPSIMWGSGVEEHDILS